MSDDGRVAADWMKIGPQALKQRLAVLDSSIRQSLGELARLPPEQFRAILPVLASAQKETAQALRRWTRSKDLSERFTAQRYRELLVQLQPALEEVKKLDPAMYQALVGGNAAASKTAMNAIRRQAATMSAKFAGTIGAPLPIARAAKIAQGSKTLLKQYRASARRYAGEVGQDIRAQIALGVVKKETIAEMSARLIAHGGPKGLVDVGAGEMEFIGEGLFRRYRYWAQRIVRTEVVESYNAAAAEEILEVHRIDPEIVMRWDASLDGRMCVECEELNGAIAAPGQMFPGGVDHPPVHPNCRCALTAWRSDWA